MNENIPDPKTLLEEAEDEFITPDLSAYAETIITLRDKGMTWRNIAAWLSHRGLHCTHNEVYYIARKRAQEEAEQEQFLEENGLDVEFVEWEPAKAVARQMKKEKEDEESEAE